MTVAVLSDLGIIQRYRLIFRCDLDEYLQFATINFISQKTETDDMHEDDSAEARQIPSLTPNGGFEIDMIRFSPNPNKAHRIHWHEWGEAAFRKAREQDKVVMLYLGAFWCGFCHRMDETSFSDDDVIVLLNAFFIPVRVENAQRPDIDIRYNQNGWPTIVFMVSNGNRLATLNYLPPEEFANMLVRVRAAYEKKRSVLLKASVVPDPEDPQKPAPASGRIRPAAVSEITNILMYYADGRNGGYGPDHKFPHPEANDFLLYRYLTTGDIRFLKHVCLTLDRMRDSATWDEKDGGFFRYSSKPDWSEPHREKLLFDQAGILQNALCLFRLTGRLIYRRLAEEIVDFMNTALSDAAGLAFYGCQDYVDRPCKKDAKFAHRPQQRFPVIDEWIYTGANALAASSYLKASQTIGRADCRDRALDVLEFLWNECRAPDGGMCHYHDGAPRVPGLLIDQVYMALALLDACQATGKDHYLKSAAQLGDGVLNKQAGPSGGFQDIREPGTALLRFPLTLIVENGIAARMFLQLEKVSRERKYRKGAFRALIAFGEDFTPYGVYASHYGRAMGEYMSLT